MHVFMDRVFASTDFDNHARLFGVMHDFLLSEAKRKASGTEASKDMDALIGSASELSESGLVSNDITSIEDDKLTNLVYRQLSSREISSIFLMERNHTMSLPRRQLWMYWLLLSIRGCIILYR
jgi:hypothetical protein